jgi:hypothetical protein
MGKVSKGYNLTGTRIFMNMFASINQILPSICPSIEYRIRKELLFQSTDQPEMIDLQTEILKDEAVQTISRSQQSDGWLAWTFHGYGSMEAGIRLLCEKGVEPTQPVLTHALCALEQHTDRLERGLGRVGKILDGLGFGGAETIRAYLFAHAGREENSLVQEQIGQALDVFRSIIRIESLESLCEPYREKFIFRAGVRWPCIYHLRLLALTQGWRTLENLSMIVAAIQHMADLSPVPSIHVKYKSQLIAPASFCMDNFTPDMHALTDAEWMQWFHRMELLARLGVNQKIPELRQQVQTLAEMLHQGQGLFTGKLNHSYFHKWGAYTGLALEADWRFPQKRVNDLTFRSLLILHYSEG